jgi:hypothetical protein
METKILLAAGIFFLGWLWFYFIMRQFLFNLMTAYPLIRKMQSIDKDLIAIGAKRYTTTSVLVCLAFSAVIIFVILYFCPLYLIISFSVGALLCLVLIISKLSPSNKAMFESFCSGYCRFVPDDELRNIMYSKEIKKINKRLRELGYQESFVPVFKN